MKNRHPKLHPTGYKNIDRATGAASGVQLTDWIPNVAVLLSAKGEGWRCEVHGRHPQCDLVHGLSPGDIATLNLKLRAPEYGNEIVNNAEGYAEQYDPNEDNNRCKVSNFLKPH